MKQLFIFLFGLLLFSSCSKSNKELAESSVKSYLDSTLNDPKSYELVNFGNLDTLYDNYTDDSIYKDLQIVKNIFQAQKNELLADDFDEYLRAKPALDKKIDSIETLQGNREKGYKPSFIGYAMTHKFRASNPMGSSILQEVYVMFDKDFKVTGLNNINE